MREREIEKYGNELTISGVVMANGNESEIIMLPGHNDVGIPNVAIYPDETSMRKIIKQLDVLEITGFEKVVLRKTQRNIEREINWKVFRRDQYACRYCGRDEVALTVDHIVTWESLGASVPENLIASCGKCNRTRGNTPYREWLKSDFYKKVSENLPERVKIKNEDAAELAEGVPLRPRRRSR